MTEPAVRASTVEEKPDSIVVLGASAGGVEALIAFFDELPRRIDVPIVVVLHRSPDTESVLDEVLRIHTSRPVIVHEDAQPLERGHVYLAPPRGELVLTEGTIAWQARTPDVEPGLPFHPIDHTFVAASERFGDGTVAVVLSGTGSDGALGARAVKAAGGVVLIEDPESAAFDSMPRTVDERVTVDLAATPAVLAATLPRILDLEASPDPGVSEDGDPVDEILRTIKDLGGFDFRSYRRTTVERRIRRRAALIDVREFTEYLELIRNSEAEREMLCRDLLINVTSFFRDPLSFESLDRLVVGPLAEAARPDRPVRVWVPACATGEEAYTIAMLLARALEKKGDGSTFQIFATDLDTRAIEAAGHGVYPLAIEQRIPRPLLERYFRRQDDRYRIRRALRERMVFAVHDLTQDPPFTRMDLVSCRNLLIYLRSELQRHVLQLIAYSLNESGYLLLGNSEATSTVREFFDPVDIESRIFSRNQAEVIAPRLHSLDSLLRRAEEKEVDTSAFDTAVRGASAVQAAVVEHLVRRDAEFALALDADLRLQHVYGDPGTALRVPSGGITTDIGALTRGEFKSALMSAVPRAIRHREDVLVSSIAMTGPGSVRSMDLHVIPLQGTASALAALALVRPPRAERAAKGGPGRLSISLDMDLEGELRSTRAQLSETIQALEISNEELQASNEEMMATNEELQSTNEELQTSNEELHTVNVEHEQKIELLTEVTHDLENVLLNSEVGTILLDRELRIHRFTTVAAEVVHLMDPDHGRPLHHITHSLVGIDLSGVARAVLDSGAGREDSVKTKDDRSFLMRCHPTRDDTGTIDGVMLTFTDVTNLERLTDELRRSERRFRHVMEHVDQAVFLRRRADQRIEFVSGYATKVFGRDVPEVLDEVLEFVHEDDVDMVRDAFAAPNEFAVEIDFRLAAGDDDDERWVRCSLQPTDDDRREDGFDVGYLFDITARKRTELELQREVERFEGFVNAIPDRFFWRGIDGPWRRLRSIMPGRVLDEKRYPPLASIVSRSALRAIEEAADKARTEGTLQAIDFDAHDTQGSRSFEARLLMVSDQGVICALRDVSELRRSERELVTLTRTLEREANSDHLTRLPNRRGLEKVLFTELERCRRLGSRLCAILVDCDNFKRVNDTMGHATGDVVLQEIGKRLRSVVRPSDTIGRVGGDEYLVLLPDTRQAEAMQLAERLRLSITGSPLKSGKDVIGITGSLGVATVPLDVVSIEEVISLTQHALSHSKKVGKNRVTSHEETGQNVQDARQELLTVLESGRGFRTFAQPILDLRTGQIEGYELLTRGPGGALESPADIFQLSSENNILTSVDLHCVKRSVGWARDHLDRGRFHVNLFPSTILDTPAARLLAVFGDPGLLQHFCVEISEQQFIGDPMYLKPHVEELRREGARIALDDVGFGRSSLESLLLLEPETVKLDKTVVQGVHDDEAKRRTLERLVGVVRGIDADIVAEGIETEADRDVLVDLGVEFGQGYLFGKPADRLMSAN